MKKNYALLLTAAAMTLAGCGSSTTTTPTETTATEETAAATAAAETTSANVKLADTTSYVIPSNRVLNTMDYLVTALSSDHEFNANFVDGLLENNSKGEYIGALAESWESNDDATEWTFHLREGVYWVTADGEEYDEVKADDFVAGLRHGAEFQSGTGSVIFGAVKGYQEYYTNGDWSDEAWANVGVEAVDDYTVKYTMESPVPYFYTMTTYAVLYPVNREFLEGSGEGCKLGSPDANACNFGNVASPDTILYNGAFKLDSYDLKSKTVMVANDKYWDIDNVHLDTVTYIYDEGEDPYSTIKGFEQGTYAASALQASWEDFDAYAEKYDGYVTQSLPNGYVFGIVFNYNRQVWNETNYANDDASREATHNAIMNANFRRALRAAYDVQAKLQTTTVAEVAQAQLRNINDVPNLVYTTDGQPYVNLVETAYEELTGNFVELDDGQNPWLSKETALEYIEAAKEEGVEFPVHLDMLVPETSDAQVKQAQSMKQSIEENTDGQIIIELVMRDMDTVRAIAYNTTNYADADYDISTFTGWGPDYGDPKTFVDIYSPTVGYYMHSCGLTDQQMSPDEFGEDDDIKTAAGWYEYEDLYRAADAITDDMDARYAAFAKADAYLIENALYIPTQQNTMSVRVSHVVPFSAPYSVSGISQYKYKFVQLQEDVVTAEDYYAAKAEWEK